MNEDDDLYDVDPRATPEKSEGEEAKAETALLPKSFFQGKELEIGSRCEVEIERVLDEEVEVRYVEHDKAKEPIEAAEPASEDESLYA